jgi:predicted DNA-binding transcriptional regulator AlpA
MGAETKATKKARKTKPTKEAPPLPAISEAMLGKAQICFALGVSLRTLQSMISTGEFPKHDTHIGKFPRWRVVTFNAWVRKQCGIAEEA